MTSTSSRPISTTLKAYGRATAGGLLFAFAALYTMEIWWQGYTVPPPVVLVTFLITLGILVLFAHYAGLHDDGSWVGNAVEAIQSVTLGFIITVVVLKLAGQLPSGIGANEAFARIVMAGASVSIGVAVGSTQLGADPDEGEGDGGGREGKEKGQIRHEFALSLLGAILIGSSVAPTEEILMIGVQAATWQALAIAVLSFAIALGIVSYTNFKGSSNSDDSVFAGGPFGDAFVTYAIALGAATAMLWSAGHFSGLGLEAAVHLIVYLAFPCALGAAAGRMLL